MIRLLFTIVAGVLLGLVVHLVSVLALPRIASQDAYSRLTPTTQLNAVTMLPAADPGYTLMPFMDPAFAVAVCRYDLSAGPIKLTVPVSQAYTSVSFYTRNEVAYYAINDRSAGKKVIELNLMTEAQHDELPEDENITAADRIGVLGWRQFGNMRETGITLPVELEHLDRGGIERLEPRDVVANVVDQLGVARRM